MSVKIDNSILPEWEFQGISSGNPEGLIVLQKINRTILEMTVSTNRSEQSVSIRAIDAAQTGGFLAVQAEIQKIWQLYMRERLACGCADCLREVGMGGIERNPL